MKNFKKVSALLLACAMFCSAVLLSGCNGGGNATYEVKVVDAQGNACTEGVIVKFEQDGASVAMQPVNNEGVVTKELAKGNYTVKLMFTDESLIGYYDEESAVLSAETTSVEIVLMNGISGDPVDLYATSPVTGESKDYKAYYVNAGSTYVSVDATERNYFLFKPEKAGTYKFSVDNNDMKIGYYGAPHFVQSSSAVDVVDNTFTISISESSIGTGGGGTTTLVIGVDGIAEKANCVLSIIRTGDPERTISDEPWTEYNTTCEVKPFTLTLGEGESLTYINIQGKTDDYKIVKSEADGYYHFGTEDGPVVYVNLGEDAPYVSIQKVIMGDGLAGGAPIRKYFFDDEENFIKKEDYTDIFTTYFENMDEELHIYPLNDDLVYMIKNGCEGWWTESSPDFIFDECNPELGWMFACCYVK